MRSILRILMVLGTSVAGSVPALAQTIDLATAGAADPIFRGEATGSRAGAWLDQGAINAGDNRRDLIIGVPGGAGRVGKVYLIFGGPIRTGDLPLSTSDTVIQGAAAGDLFGTTTAAGNILNTEGTVPRQLVVAAPGAMSNRGIVYLFAGGFHAGDTFSTTDAVARIIGAPGDQLGMALATGDLNNDGYREIIIGAPGTNRVYVIGGGTYLSGTTIDLSQPPLRVALMFEFPGFGGTVAAGDVNGDGIYDLLMSQPSSNAVYVVKGRNGMPPHVFDYVFSGIDAGDSAGAAIRLADLNADGVSDLIIAAPNGDGPGNTRPEGGEAYVIWGGAGFSSRSLANADVTFYGKDAGGLFGTRLAAGDINRDTPNDAVFGSPAARGGAGSLDIYYGRQANFGVARPDGRRVVDFANEAPSRTILGDTRGGTITSVQVFEVTGEGARDVVVGMSGNNNGVGAVYFTLSPRLTLDTSSVALAGNQGIATSSPVPVRNVSPIAITWSTSSNRPWLSATPSGSTSAAQFGDVVISANANGLLPGTYTGTIMVTSTSIHLEMSQPIDVTFTVQEAPGFPNPATPPTTGMPPGALYNILFRHSTDGYLALWQMNGITMTGVQALSINRMTNASWRIAGYGDLNGDGQRDIVWQDDAAGWLAVWFMQGQQVTGTIWLSIDRVDPNWKIRAVGDVNADGKADLIFRHTDGWLAVWTMNGAQVTGTTYLSINRLADPNWKIVGAGDTNGDGRADIVWQNKVDGWLAVWMLDGAQVVGTEVLSINKMTIPEWTIMGVGDVNGDQRADIFWQHDNGTVATWWLNGSQVIATHVLNPGRLANPAWKIAGPR